MEFDFPAAAPERQRYIRSQYLQALATGDLTRRMRLYGRVTNEEAADLCRIFHDRKFRQRVLADLGMA